MDDLAAASSCEIALEVEMESDEDSKLVSASLPVEASPSPPCPQVEMELRVVPRTVFRRPQHREYPVRLPGQHTTANLHRQSPTSLLPRREKHRRAPHTHSSHLETILFTSAGCQIGQAWLSMLHSRKEVQVKRRDFMTAHNTLNENGPWVDKIGKWDMHDWVVAASKPWWLKPIQPEEEHEVEGLLPAADVDGDVDSSFVDAFLEDEPVVASPRKRIERTESWSGAEASTRWARRTELRLREEVRPHLDRLRERRVSRVQAAERARQQRAEAAHRRIQAERLRREEEERLAAERELTRIALDPPSPDSIRRDAPAPPSRESSGSPSLSEPPEYEFPFYPVVIPRPAHLRPRPANRTRATGASTPPRYLRDLHYGSRSPSPPPPYNASTDRHTIFIEDDPEEEAMLSRIRPSGRFGSPSPVQSIVGAFPEPQPSLLAPIPVRIPGRSAWDAALELEEGEEDIVEDAFEEEVARDVVEQVPVLGQIGRLLGRVWRW